MMDTVVYLPDAGHREWRVWEKELRAMFERAGCDDAEIEHALESTKAIFLAAAAEPGVRLVPGQDAARSLNEYMRRIFGALLVAVVKGQVELYRLRGGA
jgi:hypothetical protein